jgi:malonyl-CoA decarboxylase
MAMSTSFIADLIASLTERRAVTGRRSRAAAALPPPAPPLASLCRALVSRRGEASGVAIAEEILRRWDELASADRRKFLIELAREFGPDEAKLAAAIEHWRASGSVAALNDINRAAEPRRQEVIRRLNLAPGGTARLVRMREELLRHLGSDPLLELLDADFQHLFASWFNRGFLTLRRIDWSTPANILERIIRYEAVHEIGDWHDLRLRIEPEDRRLFAFFHPQMADDPLIFVEVALMDRVPSAIAPVLAEDRPVVAADAAHVAVFYSISNCHEGLKGVSFGNFLIKQVAEDLKRELPGLDTFVTLSPVPGFAAWLAGELKSDSSALPAATRKKLCDVGPSNVADLIARSPGLRDELTAAAAYYLLEAKSRPKRPLDPVARFHLGNGARLEHINVLGDTSEKGLRQAYGLMVNYLYDLKAIEQNHEAFAERGEIAASPVVRARLGAKG